MERKSPFTLSTSFDFPSDLQQGVYTPELIEELMYRLKRMGVSRLNWLYYGDVNVESDLGGAIHYYWKYAPQTINLVGDPIKAAVGIAKKVGLEVYAVLKPFQNGLSGTYPEGSPRASKNELPHIGGRLQLVDPFVNRNPQMRCQRRFVQVADGLQSTSIRRIRLYKSDDLPTRVGKSNLQIWTSEDNFGYSRKEVDFNVTDEIVPSPSDVFDFYGELVTGKGSPVRTLILDGLNITDRYTLVTTDFTEGQGDFSNTAQAMVEVYGEGPDSLPISVATRTAMWENQRDFRTGGLEFDSGMGAFQAALDIDNAAFTPGGGGMESLPCGGLIAFARGKNEYLPTNLCESYPEVQNLWQGWVDQLLNAGVDGIDIRASAHSSFADEFEEYGFNPPVIEEYRARFDSDPTNNPEDLDRISRIRGEHYTDFIRDTSKKVRSRGKKLYAHLHAEAFRPNPCQGEILGFPGNLYFDWQKWVSEGLLDGATLRSSWNEALEDPMGAHPSGRSNIGQVLGDPIVREMLDSCQTFGLPVSMERYIARSTDCDEYLDDIETVYNDGRFAGFNLYEVVHMFRADPEGELLSSIGDWEEIIGAKAAQMGLLSRLNT